MRRVLALQHHTRAQYSAVKWTRARVAVRSVVAPVAQPKPASRFKSATRDVNCLRSDSMCRLYMSDLANVTPRYFGFGAEGQGFVWNRCYAATVKVHHVIRDHKKVANHCLEILTAFIDICWLSCWLAASHQDATYSEAKLIPCHLRIGPVCFIMRDLSRHSFFAAMRSHVRTNVDIANHRISWTLGL